MIIKFDKRAAAKHMDKIVTLVEVAQCGPALPCFTSNTTKQLKQRFLQTTPEEKLIGKNLLHIKSF